MIITLGDALKTLIKELKKKNKKTLDFLNQNAIISDVETKKDVKMKKEEIIKQYESQGYQYLGSVVCNRKAFDAYQESTKHEAIRVGNCLEIVLLHDTKKIVEYDFGD